MKLNLVPACGVKALLSLATKALDSSKLGSPILPDESRRTTKSFVVVHGIGVFLSDPCN